MYSKNLTHAYKEFRPVLALARILPRTSLSRLRWLTGIVLVGTSTVVILTTTVLSEYYHDAFLGLLFIFLALWLEQCLLYCYHNWYYFQGLDSIIGSATKQPAAMTYEVAEILHHDSEDVTAAFLRSTLGSHIALRLGLDQTAVEAFLAQPREKLAARNLPLPDNETCTLRHVVLALNTHDAALRTWFTRHGVRAEHIHGAAQFVLQPHYAAKRKARWWSRDQLSQVGGFGRSLAYGTPHELERFSQSISAHTVFANPTATTTTALSYILEIEQTLARNRAANVLLIGEPGVGKLDIIAAVAQRLARNQAVNSLSNIQLIALDTTRLLATYPQRTDLEHAFITILEQAARAGNVTIVIDNISHFINHAAQSGVDIPALLDEYLALPTLHIIGTGTPSEFQQHLSRLGSFTRRFHETIVDTTAPEATVGLLKAVALAHEKRQPIVFTYQALVAIATAAKRYLHEGVLPDKAVTLLTQVATYAQHTQVTIITEQTVQMCVHTLTGIPAGPVNAAERDGLLHLEERLHERVVGQAAALTAIAKTIRRARVDIERTDRPIGSFLFLGPTGVGKTETAKALAASFGDSAAAFVRFDMSEFSDESGLSKLLGDTHTPGLLASQLQTHPYSVVLLDEFEKASEAVRDVFLQILDEGQFTTARGEKVSARTTIIIATANAGSDLIVRTVAARQSLRTLEHDIIQYIIKHGILRPELINRFDSTIIFEPLTPDEQTEVAQLLVRQLQERIQDRGYTLQVTPELIKHLAHIGYDPQFGARPLQRLIQNTLEDKIAVRLIDGSVQPGDIITLDVSDFDAKDFVT